MRPSLCAILPIVMFHLVDVASGFGQEIVLRDLTRIQNVAVVAIHEDGVQLSDSRKLTWDRILQAKVDESLKESFDAKLKKYSLPLFRLKHRIRSGDMEGAFDIAQQWYQNDQRKFGGAEANFLVCRSVMHGRINQQETVLAVEPMIQALLLQQDLSQEFRTQFADFVFGREELKTKICDSFVPVFEDDDLSRQELKRLESTYDLDELTRRYPALAVYLSSMAIQIQQREIATDWNIAMGSVPELRPWQRLLGSDLTRAPLSRLIDGAEGSLRVAAMYWWATADEQQAPKPQRVLTLLKIVAAYSDQFPSLAQRARVAAARLADDPELTKTFSAQK